MDSSEQPPVATWRYVVPACVTSLVGLCGVAAVAATVLMPTAAERLLFGGGLVLLAAVIDAVDGPVARALNATSTFGRYLDAICDAIAFGFGAAACLVALAQDVPSIPAAALATATETVAAGSTAGDPVQAPSDSVRVLTAWLAAGLSFAHGLALAFRLAWSASATAARAGQPAPLAGGTIA
ncbi:MAG: CDP-alcohol phosphatidyltransferase family protein, partial [Planctomycetota bacterium]